MNETDNMTPTVRPSAAHYACDLISDLDHASSQCTHYPSNASKARRLERAAKRVFKAIVGRDPTNDELERCLR